MKRLNHKYFGGGGGVRVFVGREGVEHSNETAIRWKRSVLGVSCIARPVGYPNLYVLNSFARMPDVHFLVIAFGVVACA